MLYALAIVEGLAVLGLLVLAWGDRRVARKRNAGNSATGGGVDPLTWPRGRDRHRWRGGRAW